MDIYFPLTLVAFAAVITLCYVFVLFRKVSHLKLNDKKVQEIKGYILSGAMTFLIREYKLIIPFVFGVGALLAILGFVPALQGAEGIGWQAAICFVVGACFSALAGWIGMAIATKANARTAVKAKEEGMSGALKTAFGGGAVLGLSVSGFGLLGLVQWIKRKKFFQVDFNILILGAFYAIVMAFFVLFEIVELNYRPILIEGVLEASYPSSTTMLMMCVMPTAMMEFKRLIQNKTLANTLIIASGIFTAVMVLFRLISGVHWLTDIIGGALLSAGLVLLYKGICSLKKRLAERGETTALPVFASSCSRATRATSPPSVAHCMFSSKFCGSLALVMLVVESSANILSTNSSFVMLSRKFSFLSPLKCLYSLAVFPAQV